MPSDRRGGVAPGDVATPLKLDTSGALAKIGVAYSNYVPAFVADFPETIDYVEVPYELLRHDPSVIELSRRKPFVLHCASLSIAGTVPPSEATIADILNYIAVTGTPWLGEHLSFIAAERPEDAFNVDEYAPGEPYNIGYTVSPPMNEETIEIVLRSILSFKKRIGVPLLLENPPLYLKAPGTDLSQAEFIGRIFEDSSVGLLLDLSHFYITSLNMGFDAREELQRLPLERVIEVHLSGVASESGLYWDNHAARAPEVVLDLLSNVFARASVRAVTLEYNWSSRFPRSLLLDEIGRVRSVIS